MDYVEADLAEDFLEDSAPVESGKAGIVDDDEGSMDKEELCSSFAAVDDFDISQANQQVDGGHGADISSTVVPRKWIP